MVFSRNNNFIFSKNTWKFLMVVFLTSLSLFTIFPSVWNKGADSVNKLLGVNLAPHFFNFPFRLGLDLQGGTRLVYLADLSSVNQDDNAQAMEGLRDVIETRVNLFGIAEPLVQVNKSGGNYRLIVELAGIKDTAEAIKEIGETPYLEFRELKPQAELDKLMALQESAYEKISSGKNTELTQEESESLLQDPTIPTELTGKYLERADLVQNTQTYQLQISLKFNDEGAKLLEEITRRNLNRPLAVYLDGKSIIDTNGNDEIDAADFYAPTVQDVISGGEAVISGNINAQDGKELVGRFNAGALPVPISLISQETIGASLGENSLNGSLKAGLYGFVAVFVFMLLFYRLPGLVSGLALLVYAILLLAVFKIASVTLTLAGIAGVVLSLGMAVDANVLIFERLKEELKNGRNLSGSVDEGFRRAWSAILDGNLTTILTCVILFFFATGLVKGFALTLGIGIVVSMFSAIFVTKTFLKLLVGGWLEKVKQLWI